MSKKRLKIVKLSDRSKNISLTSEEALKKALESSFKKDEVIIIVYDEDSDSYEFWQSGGQSVERMLWHAEQFKQAILEGRLDKEDV